MGEAHLQYKRGCPVRIRHIIITREDVQYERSTSSVQARMCNTNQAHHQYKRECAVRAKHIFSTGEDVQYESGTSSALLKIFSD